MRINAVVGVRNTLQKEVLVICIHGAELKPNVGQIAAFGTRSEFERDATLVRDVTLGAHAVVTGSCALKDECAFASV